MRLGLFFSRSDGVIDAVVDVASLAGYFGSQYPTIVVDNFFTPSGLRSLLAEIDRNSFDAVVLAGDSPLNYQHKKGADEVINQIEARGINPNKIGFANIKEQVALAHADNPSEATEKARILVEVAIEKVKACPPTKTRGIAPHPAVAILGATPGGMLTAQRLLERDFKVYIIDKAGQFRNFAGEQNREKVTSVFASVQTNPRANFIFDAEINDIFGYAGRFNITVSVNGESSELTVGSIIVANTGDREFTEYVRPLVHVDIDQNGLFKPVNPDTLQVFTNEKGIFLLADDEKLELPYIVALSDSVAFAVTSLLEQKEIYHNILVSDINEELCSGCGTCVKTCMFKASSIDPLRKVSVIDEQRCKGCGNCVTSCPTGARDLFTYPQKYLTKAITLLSQFGGPDKVKILAFLCEGCGYAAMDLAGIKGLGYDVNVMPLGVRCGGNVDTQLILEAYNKGFNGITICKCPDSDCRNIVGNTDLDRRANLFREILRSRGIDAETLRIVEGYREEGNTCVRSIGELFKYLTESNGGEN